MKPEEMYGGWPVVLPPPHSGVMTPSLIPEPESEARWRPKRAGGSEEIVQAWQREQSGNQIERQTNMWFTTQHQPEETPRVRSQEPESR